VSDAELARIRAAYRDRDATTATPYRWANPGYVSYMQGVERSLLRGFADAGLGLDGARVLDVGCGSGYFLHRLCEYGAGECHGIDLLEERIDEARRRYPSLELRPGTATSLPFDDTSFDVVTQFTCLSSIVDDAVRLAAAQEMLRVSSRWIVSLDMRRGSRPGHGTATVELDRPELERLFGKPELLRRVPVSFALAQLAGRHDLAARVLGALPPLGSHYLGLWRTSG
jgi:SAM-dependent methyltransferase